MCVRNLLKWIGPIGVNRDEYAGRHIERKLWGYPDLVKEFHDRVRRAMVEARDERRESQDEDDAASIPPQTSFDDGSGPSDERQTDVQQDSPAQQNERPLPSDEHSLFTAPASTEAQNPTFGDPDLPLDFPRILVGGGSTLINESAEVATTPEN